MSFKAKIKKPGDMIRSEDWNETVTEIENLNSGKIDTKGGTFSGPLKITDKLSVVNDGNEWSIDGSRKDELRIKAGDSQKFVISREGSIGIGVENPHAGLVVDGPVIRKIWVSTGRGPNDEQDNGLIAGRVLDFEKFHEDTAMRIVYYDNFRVEGSGVRMGRWEILVDKIPPPGGRIFQDVYAHSGGYTNYHLPASLAGYATGLSKGKHQVTIKVGPVSSEAGNRYTGWNTSRWTIEAEEVWIHE